MRIIDADAIDICAIGQIDDNGETLVRMDDVHASIDRTPTLWPSPKGLLTDADDLISRQALMREFVEFVKPSNNSYFARVPTWNDAVSLVGSQPSVDAVSVVRCKDCRYAGVHVVTDTHEIVGHWCGLLDIDDVSDDDFCSFGKRKENEKDANCRACWQREYVEGE